MAISRVSNGVSSTTEPWKEDLKDLKVSVYNPDKTIHVNRLRDLENQLLSAGISTNLPPRRRPHALLTGLIRDCSAILERKSKKRCFTDFRYFSHFRIQILEQIPRGGQAFKSVMRSCRDEYQDTTTLQERMLI